MSYSSLFGTIIILILIIILSIFVTNIYGKESVFRITTQDENGPTIVDHTLKAQKVFEGVGFLSTMAFLGPNDILAVDKNNGTVNRIINGTPLEHPLLDVNVSNINERGLTGIAVSSKQGNTGNNHYDSSNEHVYVFLYFTKAKTSDGDDHSGKKPEGNRLYRYELIKNSVLSKGKILLKIPALPGPAHNGGIIAIGPDRNVYLIIGNVNVYENRSFWTLAENSNGTAPDGRAGILRITQDGNPVTKHGILGDTMPLKLYYAYGIRNGFGLTFDPLTGNLWDTENGPFYGDEINLVKPGFNSGWNKVQGMWQKDNSTDFRRKFTLVPKNLEDFNGRGKYSPPEFMWHKTVGVTGLTFLNSDKLGEKYNNDLFVGDFHNGNIYHFELDKSRTMLPVFSKLKDNITMGHDNLKEIIFGKKFGGITDIKVGPDGYLYVLTQHTGGSDCDPRAPKEPCVPYDVPNVSTIFRIQPK